MTFVYYISGHGYGHARRSIELIKALQAQSPGCFTHIRTSAPASLFKELQNVAVHQALIDFAVEEVEGALSLEIDAPKSARNLKKLLSHRDEIIGNEIAFLTAKRVDAVLSDISFLAGPIARRMNVQCIGVSNFTWDWIMEPLLGEGSQSETILDQVRADYSQFSMHLKLAFAHDMAKTFGHASGGAQTRVEQITALTCATYTGNRDEIRGRLGLDAGDKRKVVVLGMRGNLPGEIVRKAAKACPELVFLYASQRSERVAENVWSVSNDVNFENVMHIAEIVVGKLGYSLLANCIGNRKRMLFPPRTGFSEDVELRKGALKYLAGNEMSRADFETGNWKQDIQTVLAMDWPTEAIANGGAEICAGKILQFVK